MLQTLTRCANVIAVVIVLLGAGLGITKHAAANEAKGMPLANIPPVSPVPGGSIFALEPFYSGTDGALKEFGAARSDHATIALDIGQCYHEKFGDPIRWSPTVRAILLFELDEHLMHRLPYSNDGGDNPQRSLPVLNSFHAAAISFSDRISRDRLEFRRELEKNLSNAFWYQVCIVGLGAATTILIGIRAIMKDSTSSSGHVSVSGLVGIAAIVLSAAGVAVSSLNTFEGSQAIVLRDQRALSQLQQLHWRVASDVLKQHTLCNDHALPSDKAMEMVDAWRSRLETILDGAMESIAKPGDLSSGGATAQADARKNSPAVTASASH